MDKPMDQFDYILSHLTLEQKVGQMICISISTTYTDPEFLRFASEYPFGGVILYKRNLSSPSQVSRLTSQINTALQKQCGGVPPLIGIHQEGDVFPLFSTGVYSTPSAMALGASGQEEDAQFCGEAMGQDLAAMGITHNFGPFIETGLPGQGNLGVRSFGSDYEAVARLSAAMTRGLRRGGVTCTAKYFPGAAGQDSITRQTLVPLAAQVTAGADSIMISPEIMTAMAQNIPGAPLTSPGSLEQLLRDQLGLEGVIIAKFPEEMTSVEINAMGRTAVKGVLSGADMIVHSTSRKEQLVLYHSLLAAVKKGLISPERIDASVRRILKMKVESNRLSRERVIHHPLERQVRCRESYRRSIVLVRDPKGLLPAYPEKFGRLLVVTPEDIPIPSAPQNTYAHCNLGEFLSAGFEKTIMFPLPKTLEEAAAKVLTSEAAQCDLIVMALGENTPNPQTTRLMEQLAQFRPMVCVALQHPDGALEAPEQAAVLLAFSPSDDSMRAAAEVILGKLRATGSCPVANELFYQMEQQKQD